MSRYPSRLSRRDLYSYGFTEGQAWGDDRRALESALREIDRHEREIKDNYIYNRPTQSSPSPWLATSTPRHYPGAKAGSHYPPRYTPHFRMNRSNEAENYTPSGSSIGPWPSRAHGHGRAYRDYNEPQSQGSWRPNGNYGYADPEPPTAFHMASGIIPPATTQIYAGHIFAPPQGPASSSYKNFHPGKDSPRLSKSPNSYYPEAALASPHNSTNTMASPSGQPLVRYGDDLGQASGDDHPNAADHQPLPSPSVLQSSPWSEATNRGTYSENLSSQGTHSDGSVSMLSGYTGVSSSGYVESYGVRTDEGYYGTYRNHEEIDQDYMSDGVASDEGVYYSSSEDREDDDLDGEEEGYSSFSEDDGSYSDYE